MKNTPNISFEIIVAVAHHNVIGCENRLLWHLPADMKYFKNTTTGNIIIMGRKTFESLGRPLPNRHHIVISRNFDYEADNVEMASNLEQALLLAQIEQSKAPDKKIIVIGGGQIYKQAIDKAQKLLVTEVHGTFDGDVYFPEINKAIWKETNRESHLPDEKNIYAYDFVTFERK